MRRPLVLLALAALTMGTLPAGAVPDPIPGPLAPGWFGTDNVELHLTLPNNADSAGGRVLGDRLYVTEDRGLTIYDISDPLLPALLGFAPVPQTPYVTEEDVDTNGEVLLIGGYTGLNILDVSDPTAPTVIGTVADADEHTISCVLDCTYAYGSEGVIVDVAAQEVVGNWTLATRPEVRGSHDVTEIAPGLILTSSNPMLLLDAREDPVNPTIIGRGTFPDSRFIHGNLWPYHGEVPQDDPSYTFDPDDFDRFALVGGETAKLGGACGPTDGAFMTMEWAEDPDTGFLTFSMVDEYRVSPGTFVDGGSPYNQFCAHWFTPQPGFRDGGNVAMAWYEHGTRILTVEPDGEITDELGWIIPFGSSQSAAYWVTDEVVYTTDYQRGVDILRVDTDPPTTPEERTVAGASFTRDRALVPPWVRDAYAARTGCQLA